MTDDIYWKNFEGVAKASYTFKDEALFRQLFRQEEQGINVVGLKLDFAKAEVEFIIEAPAEEAKQVLANGIEIDEDDETIDIIDIDTIRR